MTTRDRERASSGSWSSPTPSGSSPAGNHYDVKTAGNYRFFGATDEFTATEEAVMGRA
ncbi:MAG: hypothetical protein M0P17_07635 [Methanoculleus sp.]|nr:hypothetical protein [Methanoculleus sp.]